MCWWPNLARLEKPDYLVWETGVSGFGSFRLKSRKELNIKIWRSKYIWSIEKGRNIKEPTHVLTTKFDILGKTECPVFQTGTSDFYSYKIVNISKWMSTLYISQVGPYSHTFQVIHFFLGQFGWVSLKKQRSASNDKNINSNWRFEASMMKPSSRRSKWIYGTHDLELGRGSYDILKMLQSAKPEGPVFTDQTRIWVEIFIVFD